MKYISKNAAVAVLERLFTNNSNPDMATLEEIFKATQREDKSAKVNAQWLRNKLIHLHYHNLASSVFKITDKKRLIGLQLTIEGKKALGRINPEPANLAQSPTEPTLASVMTTIEQLQKRHPEYEISFAINPRPKLNE